MRLTVCAAGGREMVHSSLSGLKEKRNRMKMEMNGCLPPVCCSRFTRLEYPGPPGIQWSLEPKGTLFRNVKIQVFQNMSWMCSGTRGLIVVRSRHRAST